MDTASGSAFGFSHPARKLAVDESVSCDKELIVGKVSGPQEINRPLSMTAVQGIRNDNELILKTLDEAITDSKSFNLKYDNKH